MLFPGGRFGGVARIRRIQVLSLPTFSSAFLRVAHHQLGHMTDQQIVQPGRGRAFFESDVQSSAQAVRYCSELLGSFLNWEWAAGARGRPRGPEMFITSFANGQAARARHCVDGPCGQDLGNLLLTIRTLQDR